MFTAKLIFESNKIAILVCMAHEAAILSSYVPFGEPVPVKVSVEGNELLVQGENPFIVNDWASSISKIINEF